MERDFRTGYIRIDVPVQPFDSPVSLLGRALLVFFANLPFLAAITVLIYLPGKLVTQFALSALQVGPLAGGLVEALTAIRPTSVVVGVAAPPRIRLACVVVPTTRGGNVTATGGAGATRGTSTGPGRAVRCSCGKTAMVTPATTTAASAASPAQSANPRVMDTLYHSARAVWCSPARATLEAPRRGRPPPGVRML